MDTWKQSNARTDDGENRPDTRTVDRRVGTPELMTERTGWSPRQLIKRTEGTSGQMIEQWVRRGR